jgi:hypothetical protein
VGWGADLGSGRTIIWDLCGGSMASSDKIMLDRPSFKIIDNIIFELNVEAKNKNEQKNKTKNTSLFMLDSHLKFESALSPYLRDSRASQT